MTRTLCTALLVWAVVGCSEPTGSLGVSNWASVRFEPVERISLWDPAAVVFSVGTDLRRSLSFADLDGDGLDDLIVVTQTAPNVRWILQDHANPGHFHPPIVFEPSVRSYFDAVAIGDVTGDGRPDFVTTSSRGVELHENRLATTGAFARAVPVELGAWAGMALEAWVQDLEGDGTSEVLVSARSDNVIALLASRSISSPPWRLIDVGRTSRPVTFVDLDGDRRLDVLSEDSAPLGPDHLQVARVEVALARPAAIDGFAPSAWYHAQSGIATTAADLDGDGRLDLVLPGYSEQGGSGFSVRRQVPASPGTFLPPAMFHPAGGGSRLETGDLDGDGRADVALADMSGVHLILGDLATSDRFLDGGQIALEDPYSALAIHDLDGDGAAEVIVLDAEHGVLAVHRGRADISRPAELAEVPTEPPLTEPAGATVQPSAVLHVDGDVACAGYQPCVRTLAEAIARAPSRSTITVRPGTYHDAVTIESRTLVVESEDGPSATTLDGQGSGATVFIGVAADVTLRGFTIRGAVPVGDRPGFGVQIEPGSHTRAVIGDNTITGNAGGGVRVGLRGILVTEVSIDANQIRSNGDPTAMSAAGGVEIDAWFSGVAPTSGWVHVTNNVIASNRSARQGGGVDVVGGSAPNMPVFLVNNTIVDNSAIQGGGVFSGGPGLYVLNNIIAQNHGDASHIDTLIQGDDLVSYQSAPFPAGGRIAFNLVGTGSWAIADHNIAGPPGFVGPTDLRLSPGSPCVDTGTTALDLARDITGSPRVRDGDGDGVARTDIGAYEL
jgi:hypothetical protein